MKLSSAVLLVLLLQFSALARAQGITLHLKNASIRTIFEEVRKQTGTIFLYEEDIIQTAKPVTIFVSNEDLSTVLRKCFDQQPLDYRIVDSTVVISKKAISLIDISDTLISVTGTVSARGAPLPGVTVSVKNSNKGTITNSNGYFGLFHISAKSIFIFSYVGYTTLEIQAPVKGSLNVELTVSANRLDEAVIIAYGISNRRLNVGNISRVTSKDIQQQSINNPIEVLQGRSAGIFVTQQTGVPGGNFSIQLRGRNSISNGTSPLYIVDGVPFSSESLNNVSLSSGIISQGSPLNSINASDIQSIEILKDADATAIYGSRGANGVVLITTKSGQSGKLSFDNRLYAGIGRLGNNMHLLNSQQYLLMRNEAMYNDGTTPGSADSDLNGDWDTSRNTDWQKELLGHTAKLTDFQSSLSGGNSLTQFRISGGYHNETTVFPGSRGFKKYSAALSLQNNTPDRRFKTNLVVSYSSVLYNLPQLDLTGIALNLPPVAPPLYDASDKLNWQNSTWDNPLAHLIQQYDSKTNNLLANFTASWSVTPSLEIKANFGYTSMTAEETSLTPKLSYRPSYQVTSGSALFNEGSLSSWIMEPQANWKHLFGKLTLNALAGLTFQQNTRATQAYSSTGFSNDELLSNRVAASETHVITDSHIDYRYNAAFGRINLNYDNRLIVDITGRRDGSSRFATENRFVNFGSVGGAWIFSKEHYFADHLHFLSFGKLRGSFGKTGSDQIPDYGYLDTYSPLPRAYAGTTGLFPTNIYNRNYGWETNNKTEAGMELGFVKDRFLFSFSYYHNLSGNQLVGYNLAPTAGFTSLPYFNLPASVVNNGVEIELSARNVEWTEFSWSSNFNITFPHNELKSYPGLTSSSNAFLYEIGKPLSIRKVFEVQGVNPQTGTMEFKDLNGDGIFNTSDLSGIINIAQQYYGGLQNNFRFRSFELNVLLQFVKQTGYDYYANQAFGVPGFMSNQPVYVLDRWQKSGDVTNVQKFSANYASTYIPYLYTSVLSNGPLVDASFIRLKNVSFNYSFREAFIKRLKLSGLQLFVHATNLLTITHYRGMDPETGTSKLPPSKIITGGIHVTF